MKIFTLALTAFLVFPGCQVNPAKPGPGAMPGTWLLYDISVLDETGAGDDDFSKNAALKKTVKDGMMLALFHDGSFSELIGDGNYKTGKWTLSRDKKILTLLRPGWTSGPIPFELQTNEKGRLTLTLNMKGRNAAVKFIHQSETTKATKDDPFLPENNTWRIKPEQAEGPEALKGRMLAYFKHLALVLKAAKEKRQDIISFQFSQGPVKIYNGGIGIHPYEIVPASWKKSFYDEKDALTAYRWFERYLQTSAGYKGAASGDWVQDDYNILLTIYADMKDADIQ